MATAYVIEKDVPAPKTRPHTVYPFPEMAVGDSFFVGRGVARANIQNAAYAYGSRNNKRFSIRAVDGGCRVWRTA